MSLAQNTKNVIVTGAAGYIGGTICIELKKQGYTVIGIDRRPLPKHLESYVDQFVNECFILLLLVVKMLVMPRQSRGLLRPWFSFGNQRMGTQASSAFAAPCHEAD